MGERRGTKALETWCRRVTQGYPGVKVENMTTSWRDGLAFCAIIHHFRPDLIDFSRLDKSDVYGNNELAFRTAERHLGIPALLDAEDMAEYPVPDRLSILTYLSQFYQAFASNGSSPVKKPVSDVGDSLMLVQGNVQSAPMGAVGRGREPCVVCQNPVFIAQRLRVSGKLYHRTCFKCARCDTQLSPTDCYETHDGRYCCETCPDEVMDEESVVPSPVDLKKVEEVEPRPPDPPPPTTTTTTTTSTTSKNIVAMRKLMFESYDKDTDDAKLRKIDIGVFRDTPVNKSLDSSVKDLPSKSEESSSDVRFIDDTNVDYNVNSKLVSQMNENNESHNHRGKPYTPLSTSLIPLSLVLDSYNPSEELVETVNSILVDDLTDTEEISVKPQETAADEITSVNKENEGMNPATESTTLKIEGLETQADTTQSKEEEEDPLWRDGDQQAVCEKEEDKVEPPSLEPEEKGMINNVLVATKALEETPKITIEDETAFTKVEDVKKEDSETNEKVESATKEEKPVKDEEYPDELNPFGDDCDEPPPRPPPPKLKTVKVSTNPFGSDSEEEEPVPLQKTPSQPIKKAPSLNPFGSDDEDEPIEETKTPQPTPRKYSTASEIVGPSPFQRNRLRSSNRSITSMRSVTSTLSYSPRKKKPAPPPPSPSTPTTPSLQRPRKTRKAPMPPSAVARQLLTERGVLSSSPTQKDRPSDPPPAPPDLSPTSPDISFVSSGGDSIVQYDSLSSSQVLPDATLDSPLGTKNHRGSSVSLGETESPSPFPLEASESDQSRPQTLPRKSKVYGGIKVLPSPPKPVARKLVPAPDPEPVPAPRSSTPVFKNPALTTPSSVSSPDPALYQDDLISPTSEKKNKDSANLNVKISEGSSYNPNKSTFGTWKRKKAPAPPLPLAPQKRTVKAMPIVNIKQELNDIEVKQQGLERQGVALENKIREKFDSEESITPYVEELVLQLFELVNEKNDLFRRQAELMYLRRQYHLEEEHAELEYQIRCLMARPDATKTDSDKEHEEQLIKRLVEVVERRDSIVQCLEMDRLREAAEDRSINTQLDIFTQAMTEEDSSEQKKSPKKHKKKKEERKSYQPEEADGMLDLDKDLDETERERQLKKKKKWYTLHHIKHRH